MRARIHKLYVEEISNCRAYLIYNPTDRQKAFELHISEQIYYDRTQLRRAVRHEVAHMLLYGAMGAGGPSGARGRKIVSEIRQKIVKVLTEMPWEAYNLAVHADEDPFAFHVIALKVFERQAQNLPGKVTAQDMVEIERRLIDATADVIARMRLRQFRGTPREKEAGRVLVPHSIFSQISEEVNELTGEEARQLINEFLVQEIIAYLAEEGLTSNPRETIYKAIKQVLPSRLRKVMERPLP